MYQYFIKVVPTVYHKLSGQVWYGILGQVRHVFTASYMVLFVHNILKCKCGVYIIRLSRPTSFLLPSIKGLQKQLSGRQGFQVCHDDIMRVVVENYINM